MYIAPGDNLGSGKALTKIWLQSKPARSFEVLYRKENQLVLLLIGYDRRYLLATCKTPKDAENVARKIDSEEEAPLKDLGVRSIDAFIELDLDDRVSAVWVEPQLRGKGYGAALYKLAYQLSPKGIESSDDLGSMSLAVWLKLYAKDKKVQIVVKGKTVPRSSIRIQGMTIKCKGYTENLTSPTGPKFRFRWTK